MALFCEVLGVALMLGAVAAWSPLVAVLLAGAFLLGFGLVVDPGVRPTPARDRDGIAR